MALLVQHIRRLQISNPPQEMIDRFEEGTVTMGSPGQGVKAIVNSRDDVLVGDPFLLRTLRLWFEIKPPAIDIEDPWAEEPQFDPYTFTLPTQAGPVAPEIVRPLKAKLRRITYSGYSEQRRFSVCCSYSSDFLPPSDARGF